MALASSFLSAADESIGATAPLIMHTVLVCLEANLLAISLSEKMSQERGVSSSFVPAWLDVNFSMHHLENVDITMIECKEA